MTTYREADHTFWYISYLAKRYPGYEPFPYWTVIQDEHPLVWLAKLEKAETFNYVCPISWQVVPHEAWKEYCAIVNAENERRERERILVVEENKKLTRWQRFKKIF